jgi:predicted SprT family Zn-dependent metalloprotease
MWKNEKVEGVEQTYRGQCDLCKNHSNELVEWYSSRIEGYVCPLCEAELTVELDHQPHDTHDSWSRE